MTQVSWGGIHNARDLGGLGLVKSGRLFRMPRPDDLDATGWSELESAGVRTLVDLRNADEVAALPLRPDTVASIARPIEEQDDPEFMENFGNSLGTPDYYAENLRRWPARVGAAVAAIADAPPGAVVVHCAAGRDRTGLIVALVLALVAVPREEILDDYVLGVRATNDYLRTSEHPHEQPRTDDELEAGIRIARESLDELLAGVDLENFLLDAGVGREQLDALRHRLLD